MPCHIWFEKPFWIGFTIHLYPDIYKCSGYFGLQLSWTREFQFSTDDYKGTNTILYSEVCLPKKTGQDETQKGIQAAHTLGQYMTSQHVLKLTSCEHITGIAYITCQQTAGEIVLYQWHITRHWDILKHPISQRPKTLSLDVLSFSQLEPRFESNDP